MSVVDRSKRAEEALKKSRRRLKLAIEAADIYLWEFDLVTLTVSSDRRFGAYLGYEPGEIASTLYGGWGSLIHPDDFPRVELALDDHIAGRARVFNFEFRMRRKDGRWRWISTRSRIIERAPLGRPLKIAGTLLDITERKEAEEHARHASQHDPLTGLPNRALIYEFGEHLLAGAQRSGGKAAVLFIDLDRFKPINDTYGHGIGDKVLREAACRLGRCVRNEDMVGRLGGDEFLAVISHLNDESDPARVARDMLEALSCTYHVEGLALHLSLSVGIALYPQDGDSMDELINHADSAMFHAKEGGRHNYQFFRPELNVRMLEALRIESALKRALEEHEFVLYYQPVIDGENQALVGVEALLRWPGMDVLPDRFIPVAETGGYMQRLGAWVLGEACRQQQEWLRSKKMPWFPIAINISPLQFRQKDFLLNVFDALEKNALAPRDVQLEVTESAIMKNVDEASAILHALRSNGIKVALDDFGTGYSSLSQLRWLPIDILKVDQSFISNIRSDAASLAITDAIIALGNTLGLEIIAEGIDSAATADLLRSRHCRLGQGFHYCRPIPAEQLEAWYSARYY